MVKQEEILQTYFFYLSNCSHDRARDHVDKEREVGRGVPQISNDPRWSQFLMTLHNLANAEKQYLAAAFIHNRGFLRKEANLKLQYENILADCEKYLRPPNQPGLPEPASLPVRPVVGKGPDPNRAGDLSDSDGSEDLELDVFTFVCWDMLVILRGRIIIMDEYEKLANTPVTSSVLKEISSSVKSVESSMKKHQSSDYSCVSESWRSVFNLEIGILQDFVRCFSSLQTWDFFESILFLQAGSDKLQSWSEAIQTREAARRLGFASSFLRGVSGVSEPHLYTWFHKLKAALLSKYSLYFYQVLAKQTTPSDMGALTSKLAVDQIGRITAFQRRTDALAVCLVFNATGLSSYKGPGYHYQEKQVNPPSGLDLYPSVFSHPSQPFQHWPSMIMLLTDKQAELSPDRTLYYFDGASMTYFLQMVEPRFTIFALYDGKRQEKDSTINSFLQEISQQLRCSKAFASIKPGFK